MTMGNGDDPGHAPQALGAGGEPGCRQLLDRLPESSWIHDLATDRIVYASPASERLWGRAVVAGRDVAAGWHRLVHADDAARLEAALRAAPRGGLDEELRITGADGGVRWFHVRSFPIASAAGEVTAVGIVAADIGARVEQQSRMQMLANYDRLTALPNRFLFAEKLTAGIAHSRRGGRRLALLLIDLDRFKNVNDTLGHRLGDELLQQVAGRLRACLRDSDAICRLGGDEFGVIVCDLESADMAAVVARKIGSALEAPFAVGCEETFVSASVGITLFPDDGADIDTLVRNADSAMYRAKESGFGSYRFHTADMDQRARRRLSLGNDLRRALARGQFELHYQPKVSCQSGEIVGVEALLRWRSPGRGVVAPGEFVPMLEETGLIVEVGEWVLREACRQARQWLASGLRLATMSVNVSGLQIEAEGFPQLVQAALVDSGLEPKYLDLELTESVLMKDPAAVAGVLGALKAMGVSLSVDDFGTGYSSLAYLRRFPLDCLKVDRSFVQDIAADPGDASITRAIITMAHELALAVVAEGVETSGQLALLIEAGCDQVQGYHFSPPVPAAEAALLMRDHRRLELGELACLRPLDGGGTHVVAGRLRDELAAAEARSAFERERDAWHARANATLQLLEEVLESVATPMLGIADDGLIAFANASCERILALYRPLVGMEAREVLPAPLLDLLAAGEPVDSDLVLAGHRLRVRGWTLGRRSPASGQVLMFETAPEPGAECLP